MVKKGVAFIHAPRRGTYCNDMMGIDFAYENDIKGL
jgi:hypothetical protein